jgi:hypothetical protein
MTYRDVREEPLIVVGSLGVQAIALSTGEPLWELAFAAHGIVSNAWSRVARVGDSVLFTNGKQALFIDAYDGSIHAKHALTFDAHQVVANAPFSVIAGTKGLACFHGAQLVWRTEVEDVKASGQGWFSPSSTRHVVYDAEGRKRRELAFWPHLASSSDLALLIGGVVAQADHK